MNRLQTLVRTMCVLVIGWLLAMSNALANDPWLDWKTIQSNNFVIHFESQHQQIAVETSEIAESIHAKLSRQLRWTPKQKTVLVLIDSTDFANGWASPLPYNRSTLIIQPPTNTGFDYTNWLEILLTHEYTHILHLDKASGAPRVIRNILGRFYWLFPNVFQPNWFIEGLATYIETDKEARIGRGQSAMFEMMMRQEVLNGVKPINKVNIRNVEWPINQSYLYGEHFYRFIEEKYGKNKVSQLVDEYSNDLVPYFINRNANKVLGKDLTTLWQEFSDYLHQRYQPQIDVIKAAGLSQDIRLTEEGFFTQEVETTANGFYYLRRNSTQTSMLMFQNEIGQDTEVFEVNYTASLDWHPQQGLLIAMPEVCDEFNIYFDLYRLQPDDLERGTGEVQRLTHCSRYSQARWSQNGEFILAVKSEAGIFQFDTLDLQGQLKETVWQGQAGDVISSFDFSNDSKLVVASMRTTQSPRLQLKKYSIKDKEWTPVVSKSGVSVAYNEVYPRFSPGGQTLYFVSDQTGVYNLYQTDLNGHEVYQLSNLLGGAFQGSPSLDGKSYLYGGYHHQGYDIFKHDFDIQNDSFKPIKQSYDSLPEKQQSNIQPKKSVTGKTSVQNSDKMTNDMRNKKSPSTMNIEDYSPWSSLKPYYWFPFAQATEDDVNLGAQTSGSDALGIHNYFAAVATNLTKQNLYGIVNYSYSRYFDLSLDRQYDYSEEVDDITSYRMEDSVDVLFHLPRLNLSSQWDFYLGASSISGKEGVYFNDSDYTIYQKDKDAVVGLGFQFNNSENFFRSISQNDGRQVILHAESSDLIDSDYSGNIYTLDWREYIQLSDEHTLALRYVQGYGSENPNPFRLGGDEGDGFYFQSNNLNQRSYALRAYDRGLPELLGRRMQLASVEYRFPLARIEKTWMAPPVGMGDISATVFYERASVYHDSPVNYYSGAGLEVKAQLTLFYALGLDLYFGVAKALDLDKSERAYFRIGTSF